MKMEVSTAGAGKAAQITVDEWNRELVNKLLPDTICLAIYLVLGVVGNILVLLVYIKRSGLRNEDRFFIPILALFDLFTCVVNSSFSLSINVLPVKFYSDQACKIMWYFATLTTATSALTLVIIAINRYLKICRPFGRQVSLAWKKLSVAFIVFIAAILALPCFAFYGSAEVKKDDCNLTGRRCTSVTAGVPTIGIAYKISLFLIILTILVVLSIAYCLIGRVYMKQTKYYLRLNSPNRTSLSLPANRDINAPADGSAIPEDLREMDSNSGENMTEAHDAKRCDVRDSREKRVSNIEKRITKNLDHSRRITVMFMVITLVFVISFIPKLILMVWESGKPKFWLTLSPSDLGIYRFMYTFYVVNNIANPFIYGFLDPLFRKEFLKLWHRQ